MAEKDYKIFEILTLTKEYRDKQNELQVLFSNGYFQLSKSKYILGPLTVSSFQYDKIMNKTRDPITMFSSLPPVCLVQAQKEFKLSLELIREINFLTCRIFDLINKIND